MTRLGLGFSCALAFALSACGEAPPPAASAPPTASAPHWAYAGDEGPLHWADLDPSFSLCRSGASQSPIDLPASGAKKGAAQDKPHWDPVPIHATNNGYSVQVDDQAGGLLVVDGTTYTLKQLHVHSPSEHTIAGKSFAAEIHFVHKSADGKLAVVALLLDPGKENPTLAPFLSHLPAKGAPPVDAPQDTLDIAALLPAAPRFLRYQGSLTTPPCTEGVSWLVLEPDGSAQISSSELEALRGALPPNNLRPVQPLGAREVVESSP
jgi:carbonic anhydrase